MVNKTIHYRIVAGALDVFVDQTLYTSKEEAENAATALIITSGGPPILYIYALAAQVSVATKAEDSMAAPPP